MEARPRISSGAVTTGYRVLAGDQWIDLPQGEVIEESECCIFVNGQELATFAATPVQLEALALGFLTNEGLISGLEDVRDLTLRGEGYCVDVWLDHTIELPKRKILTSGCTGGITFDQLALKLPPLPDSEPVEAASLTAAMRVLYQNSHLYRLTRGVHTSILWRDGNLLAAAEDVGRHNTLDKLRGLCLQQNLATQGSILLSSGRISSEMLSKASRMGCPVVVSRTSATSLSVQLAREWNLTLVGYLRSNVSDPSSWKMIVYSHPERILMAEK